MPINVHNKSLTGKFLAAVLSLLLLWCAALPLGSRANAATPPEWTSVDQGGLNLASDINHNVHDPSVASWNGKLYVAWSQQSDSFSNDLRVMQWDGDQWTPADGGQSLNYDSNQSASNSSLAVYQGCLYAVWSESTSDYRINQIRVKRNCGSAWEPADGGSPLDGSGNGQLPVIAVYHDTLFVAWMGNSDGTARKIQVAKYDGNTWVQDATDLTFSSSGSAYGPKFAVYQDQLYLTWSEQTTVSPYLSYIPVMQRTGDSDWTNVSGDTGLSDSTKSVGSPVLQAYNGLLYAVWRDNVAPQLKISSYDGSSWSAVGSGTLTTTAGSNPQSPNMTVYNQKLFVSWVDYSGITSMTNKVQEFDGTSWTQVSEGITGDDVSSDGSSASLVALDNKLYMGWTSLSYIRVFMLQEPPAAPTGLSAVAGTGEVTLNWNVGSQITSYRIYEGTSSGVYDSTPIATVDGSTGSYTVQGLESGTTYYFAVTASNDNGEGSYSSEASAQPLAPVPAPDLTGITWVQGTEPGTTQATALPESASYKYAIGGAGQYPRPMVGDDPVTAGYSQTLDLHDNIAVTDGDYFFVVELDSDGKIAKWTEQPVLDENIAPSPAPELTGIGWAPGHGLGTTKATALPEDATFKYVVGEAGSHSRPMVGDDAAAAGYAAELLQGGDIAVTSGQHIYVALVDNASRIVKWADVAVQDKNIKTALPLPGDVNGDGFVTPVDALYITQYTAQKITLTDEQFDTLDMNGDGALDNADITIIMKIYLGVN